jgi:signal transduction histidine kinase/DNA-binding response OmpR family regulator/ligand-binding sensor domain-containing protein
MQDGTILVGSDRGLFTIDPTNRKLMRPRAYGSTWTKLDTLIIHAFAEESPGVIWIGTLTDGLYKLDWIGKKLTHYPRDRILPAKNMGDLLSDLKIDNRGRFWIATTGGLFLFDRTSAKHLPYLVLSSSVVGSRLGVFLSTDATGTLWVSDCSNGVYFLPPRSFRFPNFGLATTDNRPAEMTTIDKADDHGFWINSEGNVIRLDMDEMKITEIDDVFHGEKCGYGWKGAWDSFRDERGNLWYGSWGLGLFKFDPFSRQSMNYRSSPSEVPLNVCCSIAKGGGDSIWIAGQVAGVMTFNVTQKRFTYRKNIRAPSPMGIMADRSGKIWISDELDGLFVFDPSTDSTINYRNDPQNPSSLSGNRPRKTIEDSKGRIWIGCRDGLNLWQPQNKSFRRYTIPAFIGGSVDPLGNDAQGRLWINCYGGLVILDPVSEKFTDFDYSDGFCGDVNSMYLMEDGKILLAGAAGMNVLYAESLFTSVPPPPFVITRMTIDDSVDISISTLVNSSKRQFPYQENVLEFEFAAIDPGATHFIEYLYRLEGLEDSWVKPANRRFVRYTGLSPGDYVFRVKAINKHGRWQDQEIALAFSIAPPWWKTWWAYAFYGFSFLGFLYAGYRLRLKQVRLKQRLEMEHFQTEHLAEVDRLKSRFFSNISHEFRTPLTLILGPAEQMMDQSKDTIARQKLYLIKDNAKKLLGLVNQLLDFSRLESGVMKLQVSGGDIVQFLRRVVMSFESWAEKKKITLAFTSEIGSVEGYNDADKLEKIMNNLMSNALKFTPEGGSVQTCVCRRGGSRSAPVEEGCLEITVRDTGPGISPEHLPHIFDRFYRVDDTHTTEGTGIGLALVKELVQLHHGTIEAESAIGQGSIFTVMLPIDRSAYASDEIVAAPAQRGEGERVEMVESSREVMPAPAEKPSEGKPIVLIVEDNTDLRTYIREFLENDYAVREAGDGEAGYNTAIEIVPDIIISDIMMPKMDGIKLCRMLKQDVRTSHVPVILLTARAGTDSKIEGLETGADDYITKPFDARELFARVKNLIEQRRQLRQKFSAGTVLKPGEVAVTSLDDDLLKRVMAAVEKNIGNADYDVDALAQEACLSRPHLNRKLQALTNLSPAEFIRYVRLQRAREFLEKNTGSVAEIAFQVGFVNPAHFSKCFHERFGYSPSNVHRQSSINSD